MFHRNTFSSALASFSSPLASFASPLASFSSALASFASPLASFSSALNSNCVSPSFFSTRPIYSSSSSNSLCPQQEKDDEGPLFNPDRPYALISWLPIEIETPSIKSDDDSDDDVIFINYIKHSEIG